MKKIAFALAMTGLAACGVSNNNASRPLADSLSSDVQTFRVAYMNTARPIGGIACDVQIAGIEGVKNLHRANVISTANTTVLDFNASLETARKVAALSCGHVRNVVSGEPISAASSGDLSTYHVTFDITRPEGQADCATQIAAIEGIQNLRDAEVPGIHRATTVAQEFEATAEVAAIVAALSCADVVKNSVASSSDLSTYHVTFDITRPEGQADCATQIAAIEGIQNLRDAEVPGIHRATTVAQEFEATAEVAAIVADLSCASVRERSSEP